MHSPVYSNDLATHAPHVERRSHPRFSFCAATEAVDMGSRSLLKARVSDIGRGGCYVDAFSPFPLQTPVQLRITSNKRTFEANARVANSQLGMGMGLQFCGVEAEQLGVLDGWLAELGNESPFEFEKIVETKSSNGAEQLIKSVLVENKEKAAGEPVSGEQWLVLNELVIALIRKRVLSHDEGQGMLRKLYEKKVFN